MEHRSQKQRILRILRIGARAYVIAYLVGVLGLAIFQRHLMYLPERSTEAAILDKARLYGGVPWRNAQGTIIGWKRANKLGKTAANRLIVFHGNAGNALDRMPYSEGFEKLDGGALWEVYLFEYPGYGARPGPISEADFKNAGAAAMAQLRSEDSRPIYIAGESVGSGLACAMAHDNAATVKGLLLVTPFSSMADAAASHFQLVPVRLLIRDRWNNMAMLPAFHGPLAVILAGADTIVPPALGKQLFAAGNEPKRLWVMPGVDHNDIDFSLDAGWWQEVSDFLLSPKRGAQKLN